MILPMQETWVWSLIHEDPTCCRAANHVPQLLSLCSRAQEPRKNALKQCKLKLRKKLSISNSIPCKNIFQKWKWGRDKTANRVQQTSTNRSEIIRSRCQLLWIHFIWYWIYTLMSLNLQIFIYERRRIRILWDFYEDQMKWK